jgi:nucleoside 2-deoxyribosyltransferase
MMTVVDFLWPPTLQYDERDVRIGQLEVKAGEAHDQRIRLSDQVIANINITRYIMDRGTREELVRVRHFVRGDE